MRSFYRRTQALAEDQICLPEEVDIAPADPFLLINTRINISNTNVKLHQQMEVPEMHSRLELVVEALADPLL